MEIPTPWQLITWNGTGSLVRLQSFQMGALCFQKLNCRPLWASWMRWRSQSRKDHARSPLDHIERWTF